MMSKKKKKSKKPVEFEPSFTSVDSRSTRASSVSSEIMNQRFSGQLSKYTNLVKGWKFRWFVLDPVTGMLHYYLSENEISGNPRGGIHLQGVLICPSDEDSHTFYVNSPSGEVFKLRAMDARARQEWVNKLRSVAEHHSANLPKCITPKDCSVSIYSGAFINTPATSESFVSAKEHLLEAEQKCLRVCKVIEVLPTQGSVTCVDPQLLILKACSQSLVTSLRDCVDILQRTFLADYTTYNKPITSAAESKPTPPTTFVSHIKKK